MSYKLVPRFYYSLPFLSYFRSDSKSSIGSLKSRIYLNSARTSLRILLSSISKESMKVGVQVYTCHTVFQAILKAGHTPVFIDINDEFLLSLDDLRSKIDVIDILLVTHTFGFIEQIDEIRTITKEKIVIEDCAHSFMSETGGRKTGELADASIFSTGLAKFPAIGAGGFHIINNQNRFPYHDDELLKLVRPGHIKSSVSLLKTLLFSVIMRAPLYGAITYKLGKKLDSKLDFVSKFSFKENLSMNWVERTFKASINKIEKQLRMQRKNGRLIQSLLKSNIKVKSIKNSDRPNFYAYPILIRNRDQLFNELLFHNIESGKHFFKSISWAKEFGYVNGDCPNTEYIINNVLTLPIHAGVSETVIKRMAEIVNKYE